MENEGMDYTFDEQIAAVLGEDFRYSLSIPSKTPSPIHLGTLDYPSNASPIPSPTNLVCESLITIIDNENINNNGDLTTSCQQPTDESLNDDERNNMTKKSETKQQKRKREPHQVHHHIIAERKRRELLTQRFIALSAIVPGLKKMDKTTVLGEAIKYLQELQEKVKALEEETAKRTVESVMVVKKSQLIIDNDGVDDNYSSCSLADNNSTNITNTGGSGGGSGGGTNDSLPEIEVKVSGNTLLLKVYCEKQKGILSKLFAELEKHDISITSSYIIPFGCSVSDITIVAQMEKGLDKNVKELVRALDSALRMQSM